jgi:hypothetical protein
MLIDEVDHTGVIVEALAASTDVLRATSSEHTRIADATQVGHETVTQIRKVELRDRILVALAFILFIAVATFIVVRRLHAVGQGVAGGLIATVRSLLRSTPELQKPPHPTRGLPSQPTNDALPQQPPDILYMPRVNV